KLQTASSKLQRSSKCKAPRLKQEGLKFDFNFCETWNLEPGAFKILALLLVLATLSRSQLFAQTNAAKAAPRANRYLLVVETSRSMKPRLEATLKLVQGLLVSGMNGQLRRGDTLGIWTFSEDLYAGRF